MLTLISREKLVPGMQLRLLTEDELTTLVNRDLVVHQEQRDGWSSADDFTGYYLSRVMLQELQDTVWTADDNLVLQPADTPWGIEPWMLVPVSTQEWGVYFPQTMRCINGTWFTVTLGDDGVTVRVANNDMLADAMIARFTSQGLVVDTLGDDQITGRFARQWGDLEHNLVDEYEEYE